MTLRPATTKKRTRLECLIPILSVKSLRRSLNYYIKVLGFKKDWEDSPEIASVSRDKFHIMLAQGTQGHRGTWIWIGVEDVVPFYREYRRSGAKILLEPTNYPWAYEMRVEDPDGHVLRIGSAPKPEKGDN